MGKTKPPTTDPRKHADTGAAEPLARLEASVAELLKLRDDLAAIVEEFRGLNAARAASTPRGERELIEHTLFHLRAGGNRSKAMTLPRDLLIELCERLLDPGQTTIDVGRWINDLAVKSPVPFAALDDNAVYRFHKRFTRVYEELAF